METQTLLFGELYSSVGTAAPGTCGDKGMEVCNQLLDFNVSLYTAKFKKINIKKV